ALFVAFLAWLSRTVEITPALGGGKPVDSPSWAIGWWFVPIACLWKPYAVVRDVWKRLATASRRGGSELVLGWWLLLLGAPIAISVAGGTFDALPGGAVDATTFGYLFVAWGIVTGAAVLGFLVVSEIQARADERAAGLGFEQPLPTAEAPPSNGALGRPPGAVMAGAGAVGGTVPNVGPRHGAALQVASVRPSTCPSCGTGGIAGRSACQLCGFALV
ncbi:MAG: DUF4328 domain-containing protein, partial [Chloroflexota bacterium]